MSDAEQWQLVVGFFVPILFAFISKVAWTESYKAAAAFVTMLIVALMTMAVTGGAQGTPLHMAVQVLYTVMTSFVSYKALWKPTGIADLIERTFFPGELPAPTN